MILRSARSNSAVPVGSNHQATVPSGRGRNTPRQNKRVYSSGKSIEKLKSTPNTRTIGQIRENFQHKKTGKMPWRRVAVHASLNPSENLYFIGSLAPNLRSIRFNNGQVFNRSWINNAKREGIIYQIPRKTPRRTFAVPIKTKRPKSLRIKKKDIIQLFEGYTPA